MTSCNGDCTTFPANDARWFKIDAVGYDSAKQQWAAAKLIAGALTYDISVCFTVKIFVGNASWTSIIPVGLATGQYVGFDLDVLSSSTLTRSQLSSFAMRCRLSFTAGK